MSHFSNQMLFQYNLCQEYSAYDESRNDDPLIPQINRFESLKSYVDSALPNNIPRHLETKINSSPVNKIVKKVTKHSKVDTSNFSIEERLVAAVWVHERKRTGTSMNQIKNQYRLRFGHNPPTKNTLLVWERKLFTSGSVHDAPRTGRPVKRKNHIEKVEASILSAPTMSLRARASTLCVPHTTLRTILQKDLPNTFQKKKTILKQNSRH